MTTPDPREHANAIARSLRLEFAGRPDVLAIEVRGDPPWIALIVNVPVDDPGRLVARLGGVNVFRRQEGHP